METPKIPQVFTSYFRDDHPPALENIHRPRAEALLGFELGSDGHGAVVEGGLVGTAGHGCHG